MAEVKLLTPPPALYDYVLYYECASKDWSNIKKKSSISGDGGLMSAINWNSTYSYDPDDAGGKTLFGVTESVWKNYVNKYPNKNYSLDLNKMGKSGWLDVCGYYWNDVSYACNSANYACAFILFQMAWGGFNTTNRNNLLKKLKTNADKKDYQFVNTSVIYKALADATNAYTDPMVAYSYMRNALISYYYNISTPDTTNKKYRVGWLNRTALPFTLYGLYIPTSFDASNVGLKYESTIQQWDSKITELITQNKSGYVKIFDWGLDPETSSQSSYQYVLKYEPQSYSSNYSNSSNNYNGTYGNCGNVSRLGSYTNSTVQTSTQQINAQTKNRENVLKKLIEGSYNPDTIKQCKELLTSDKKKDIKTKSES